MASNNPPNTSTRISPEDANLEAAIASVQAAMGDGPSPGLAVVAGSGLGGLAAIGRVRAELGFDAIPGLGTGAVEGHAGRWLLIEVGAARVFVLLGRRHLYEGISPRAAALAIRVLARLDVGRVVLTNAAGGLTRRLAPGDLMLVTDHINLMFANPLLGPNDERLGPRFPDMSRPYSPALCGLIREAARERGIPLKEGVYAAVSGPTYETRAEAAMLARLGAGAAGMSTVPEVLAARHAGLEVAAVSLITNTHADPRHGPTTHEEVLESARRSGDRLAELVRAVIERI